MKKLSFLLIILLLVTSVAYGSLDENIGNHWSKGLIEEEFMKSFFPYLTDNDFLKFNPRADIRVSDFSKSINLLFKTYDYETRTILNNDFLSRENMVEILGRELLAIGLSVDGNVDIPFKDINTMDETSIDLLRLLYKLDIIKGDTNSQFSPMRNLSQGEAIIILQRARGRLNTMDTISFKTLGLVQTFNGKEEITLIPQEDKVLVTITKEFPTPGYNMEVKNIIKTRDGYKVNFKITSPPSDSIQLQVITYKTISLEIDKNVLGDMPYNFILEGYHGI